MLVHVERHVRLVQVAARAAHRALNRHVFLEKREPLSSIDSTAPLSMSERPFIKVPLNAASFRSACAKRPLRHHFLQSHPG